MLKGLGWVSALALTLSNSMPAGSEASGIVADHDLHPGLGHPEEGDSQHEHGDADDHHETPDSPCHHHDSHSCCTQGVTVALVGSPMGSDSGNSSRIRVPTLQAHTLPSVVELLHVPIA